MLKWLRSKRKSGGRQPNTEKKQYTFLCIRLKRYKRTSNSKKAAENQGNLPHSIDTCPKPPFIRSIVERRHSVDYEISITKSMSMTGFYNLRSSCYFKSVLQNLFLLHPFREHLICTITRTEYRLVLEKYPHFNTFINSNKKGKPRKLIRATTFQSKATKGTFNRNISRQNECQLRIVECIYCSATIHYTLLKYHNKICPEFPLVCPNECLKSLIRKELKSHIEKECPNTLITCPYKEMGCEVLIKRSELPEHEKPFESKHFDKTEVFYLNKIKKLESIIEEKEDKNKPLKSILEEKEDENKQLKSIIQGKEDGNKHLKSIIEEEEDENKQLKSIIQEKEDENKQLKSIIQEKEDENKQLKSIIEEKEDENKQLNAIVQNMEKDTKSEPSGNGGKEDPNKRNLFTTILKIMPALLNHFNPVKEPGEKRKHNLESITYKTENAATEGQKRQKQSDDCKDNITTMYMHVIGLSNLGNTCYFNSVLQNLLYLRPFRELLTYTMTRTKYKLVPKKHPELKTIEFASDKKAEPGQLTQELFNLIQETVYQSEATEGTSGKKARNTQKIVKPRAVQIEIAKKHDKFSDGSQQDSHELFRSMIDMVKDEEIKRLKEAFEKHFNNKDNKTQSKNCSVDGKNLKKYASEFENIFVFTGTFIDDTFGGKMLSTVKCEGCKNILNVNEDFLDISLPLPECNEKDNNLSSNQPQSGIESNSEEEVNVKSKEVKRLNHMANDYPKDSLEYYLMRFFSPIFLEDDYVCNTCNPQLVSNQDETSDMSSDENDDTDSIDYDALIFTSAVKQFHIKTVGPVLTIHLKRFSQTGYGLQKLDKRVDFPLELDMSPFCVSDTSVPKDFNNQILYGLRGVVDHSGGMFGGHYVAHVNIADWNAKNSFARKNGTYKSPDSNRKSALPEEWYTISDSHISNTNHADVFSSQAYILFYERLPL